jgi:hypothetical protein
MDWTNDLTPKKAGANNLIVSFFPNFIGGKS